MTLRPCYHWDHATRRPVSPPTRLLLTYRRMCYFIMNRLRVLPRLLLSTRLSLQLLALPHLERTAPLPAPRYSRQFLSPSIFLAFKSWHSRRPQLVCPTVVRNA